MVPFLWLFLVRLAAQGTEAIRLKTLQVPGAVVHGEPVLLMCDFDMEGDELYSVKWYKNNVEFYRYQPQDKIHGQKYELLGVNVDLRLSNHSHVFIQRADLNTEGTYACEVSAEAPSFNTVKAEGELRVYVLPKSNPVIEGADYLYQTGDRVNVTCNAGPSKPAATLRWYINGIPAHSAFERRYPLIRHYSGLQSSQVGLDFIVRSSDLFRGGMKLRCVASISQVYSCSSVEIVIDARGHSSGSHHVIPNTVPGIEGPKIMGIQPRYEIGDNVDINCTSSPSKTEAELKWSVNEKEVFPNLTTQFPPIRYVDGLVSSLLGLHFRVEQKQFKSDELRLKCTATLYRVTTSYSEKTVTGANQQRSDFHAYDNTASVLNSAVDQAFRWWPVGFAVATAVLL